MKLYKYRRVIDAFLVLETRFSALKNAHYCIYDYIIDNKSVFKAQKIGFLLRVKSIMFFNCLLLETQKYTTKRSWVVYLTYTTKRSWVVYALRILTVSSWRTILYNDWNLLRPLVPPNFYTTIGDHFISNSKIHNRSCIIEQNTPLQTKPAVVFYTSIE